jgi:type II secretory pathway pseudopilin PulG
MNSAMIGTRPTQTIRNLLVTTVTSRHRRALTLLELIVTALIMFVLATVGITSLSGVTNAVQLRIADAALVNVANGAQANAIWAGSSIPGPKDFTAALSGNNAAPNGDQAMTNATSVITDPSPATGATVASSTPGQVSVRVGTIGSGIPATGAAMLLSDGSCALVRIVPSAMQSFNLPPGSNQCTGQAALAGPGG